MGIATLAPTGNAIFDVTGALSSTQAEETFVVVVNDRGSDTTISDGQYLGFSNTDGTSRGVTIAGDGRSATIDAKT